MESAQIPFANDYFIRPPARKSGGLILINGYIRFYFMDNLS